MDTWKTECTPGRGYEHQEESAQQEHGVHTRKKIGHKVWNNRRESSPARLKRRLRECDSEAYTLKVESMGVCRS